jgi:hypothetical protein
MHYQTRGGCSVDMRLRVQLPCTVPILDHLCLCWNFGQIAVLQLAQDDEEEQQRKKLRKKKNKKKGIKKPAIAAA